jgi:hypothetical protein
MGTREEYLKRQALIAEKFNLATVSGTGDLPPEAQFMKDYGKNMGRITQQAAVDRPTNTSYDQALDMILGGMLPMTAASPGSTENAADFRAIGTGALDFLGLLSPALALGQSTGEAISGEGFNFRENLKEAQSVVQARKESAPVSSTLANLGTGLPASFGASKTLDAALLPFKYGARTAGQATLGAAEGGSFAYGTGQSDPETMMALGGVLGGVAGNIGPKTPFAGSAADKAKYGAADALLARAGEFSGVPTGYNSAMIAEELDKLGPLSTISDASPVMRQRVQSAITPGMDPEAAGDLARMTQSRDIPQIAQQEITDILAPNLSASARNYMSKEILADLQNTYTKVFKDAEAKGIKYPTQQFLDEINITFGPNPAGIEASARDSIVKIVNQLTEGGTKELTPNTLLNLKKQLNYVYRGFDQNAGSLPKEVKAMVADLTKKTNAVLRETVDGYENVSKLYADEATIQEATDFAKDVFMSRKGTTVDDLRMAMDDMSEVERMAVGLEARNQIFAQLESGTTASVMRKIHPNKDTGAMADKLAIIFGDDQANKLIDASIKLHEFRATNELLDSARVRAGGGRALDLSGAGTDADMTALALAAAQNRMSGGPALGALRRMFVSGAQSGQQNIENVIARSGALQGQAAIENIRMLEEYLKQGSKFSTGAGGTTSMLGLALGNQQ